MSGERALTEKEAARFMNHVVEEPNSGCWLWNGTQNGRYGQFNVRLTQGKSQGLLAHRVSYRHFVGPIEDDLRVCHRCDVPPCVNPDHLWLGTDSDNLRDAVNKGRHVSNFRTMLGMDHPQAKLTDKAVREMRFVAERFGWSVPMLARAFEVDRKTVRRVLRGDSWWNVGPLAAIGAEMERVR